MHVPKVNYARFYYESNQETMVTVVKSWFPQTDHGYAVKTGFYYKKKKNSLHKGCLFNVIIKMITFCVYFAFISVVTSVNSDSTIASNTGDETQDTSDNTETIPSEQGKKRKRKVEVSDMMTAFLDMQKKQHEEFMQGEHLRYQQEKEMLDNWMKAQVQMEERRLQQQREERQETNMMFLQTINRLFDAMIPSHSHHQPSPHHPSPHAPPPTPPPAATPPPTLPPHLQYPYHAETSSSYSELDNSTHVYRNL